MIPAGTCFCHRCGNVFKDAYYKSGVTPVGAKLKRAAVNIGKTHWEIEPFRPDGGEIRLEQAPWLESVGAEKDGIPNSIHCKFGTEGAVYELLRACPMCKTEDTVLVTDCGRHPTFVVAMVGARETGKTTWLKAVATTTNLFAVNQVEQYPYEIDFVTKYADADWEMTATDRGSSGETNYLRIREKASGEIVANVIFLDAAGELFSELNQSDNAQRKFLFGNGGFSGVDAVVYVESAERAIRPNNTKEDRERYSKSFQVYQAMEETGALENKPVAFVYTHTDQIIKNKGTIPRITDMSDEREVPVCTETTFRGKTSYAPSALLPRLLQEDIIARKINTTVLCSTAKNRRGFMIQTCFREKPGDSPEWNNHRKNFNVMDPLLWLLNTLKLFPIPCQK